MEESTAVVEMSSSSHVASTSSSVVEESTFTSSQQITQMSSEMSSSSSFSSMRMESSSGAISESVPSAFSLDVSDLIPADLMSSAASSALSQMASMTSSSSMSSTSMSSTSLSSSSSTSVVQQSSFVSSSESSMTQVMESSSTEFKEEMAAITEMKEPAPSVNGAENCVVGAAAAEESPAAAAAPPASATEINSAETLSVQQLTSSSVHCKEIEQENIKHALHEIISEIDREMEADFNEDEAVNSQPSVEARAEIENMASSLSEDISTLMRSAEAAQRRRSPPPVAAKKSRPVSMPADFSNMDDNNPTAISPDSGRPIDLQKIFTPASDSGELTPRRRRMFASSSFYSPFHPSMQEQVELARQISHSLSAADNRLSKGQTMYVKRRNRSMKWIHEEAAGESAKNETFIEEETTYKTCSSAPQECQSRAKSPMKLVLNPKGKIWDINAMRNSGLVYEPPPLSPEVCSNLVKDLNTQKGKGAAMFAKRKQKSEKWVVAENQPKPSAASAEQNVQPASPVKPVTAPATPNPTNYRAEQNQKINTVQDRFSGPRIQMVKSPWEAALSDGNVDAAFKSTKAVPAAAAAVVAAAAEVKAPAPAPAPAVNPIPPPTLVMDGPPPTNTLTPAAPIQPKLIMKPLDSVPKLTPHFNAPSLLSSSPVVEIKAPAPAPAPAPVEAPPAPAPAPAPEPTPAPTPAPVEVEKPFTLPPVRPSAADPLKPKAPKGWGPSSGDGLSTVSTTFTNETLTSSHVQVEVFEQRKVETVAVKSEEFKLPSLKSVPEVVKAEPPRAEIQLPTLKSVPEPKPELPKAEIQLPQLKSVPQTEVKAEPERAELQLPQLRPVVEQKAEEEVRPEPAVEWQPPPLDSRPNLQALLERERQQTMSALNVNPPPTPKPTPKLTPVVEMKPFKPEVEEESSQDGEVARLSVRAKAQRFEAATKSVTVQNTTTSSSTISSQSSSVRVSVASSPKMERKFPASQPPARPSPAPVVSDRISKENAAPIKMAAEQPAAKLIPSGAIQSEAKIQYTAQVQTIETIKPTFAPAGIDMDTFSQPPPAVVLRQPPILQSPGKSSLFEMDTASKRRSLADFTNHNTAPRGWNQSKEIYRPVTFNHG